MTFFEKELRKITNDYEDAKFIGRAMYIPLGENNRLKIEFIDSKAKDDFDTLRITALDKNSGIIDKTNIFFSDIWGQKKINDRIVHPHIWNYDGNLRWYGYTPTSKSYEILVKQIDDYYEMFSEEQTQIFNTSQSM